jgi:hypothetical protein
MPFGDRGCRSGCPTTPTPSGHAGRPMASCRSATTSRATVSPPGLRGAAAGRRRSVPLGLTSCATCERAKEPPTAVRASGLPRHRRPDGHVARRSAIVTRDIRWNSAPGTVRPAEDSGPPRRPAAVLDTFRLLCQLPTTFRATLDAPRSGASHTARRDVPIDLTVCATCYAGDEALAGGRSLHPRPHRPLPLGPPAGSTHDGCRGAAGRSCHSAAAAANCAFRPHGTARPPGDAPAPPITGCHFGGPQPAAAGT